MALPRLSIRIDLGSDDRVGPGKIALLRAVRSERSISAAARSLGMSYRRAWLLVDALNRSFGAALVETHVGGSRQGGARLSKLGDAVVDGYDEIARRAAGAAGPTLKKFAALRRKG